MNFLYRLLLTFNATSLILVIFLIKEDITINTILDISYQIPNYVSFILYLCIPILLTGVSLLLAKCLGTSNIEMNGIQEIESANNAFLPSYLGYFFVALSVENCDTLVFVFIILFIFTFLSQTLYFNPLFLIFGYHFYNITTTNKVKLFLITRQKIKRPQGLGFDKLKRINNFTFID